MHPIFLRTGVVGTGAMGRGIAQMAAQAGSEVWLFDVQEGAAEAARQALANTWQTLVGKNRMQPSEMDACLARLHLATQLADLSPCDLVVEAVVERLDVKQRLFAELEAIVKPESVLATNTSSLSVTAIGAALAGARHVRTIEEPHLSPWLACWAECRPAPSLFPTVATRCDSFSQWWSLASRGLQTAADLLAINEPPAP